MSIPVLILALAPATIAVASAPAAQPVQTVPVSDTGAQDVVVSSFYWGRLEDVDVGIGDSFPPSAAEAARLRRKRMRYGGPPEPQLMRRETYALVRNTGNRKVRTVTWDYVFYDSDKRDHELKRFQFKSKDSIGPGEMKFLTAIVGDAPLSSYSSVEIQRIEYENGAPWERSPRSTPSPTQ